MARTWTDATAFRPDPEAAPGARPTRRQSLALLAALLLVAGVVSVVSYAVRPDRARTFDLLHGSVLIGDQFGPVNVDLGSGKGTLQLRGADAQVGVRTPGDLAVVPFDDGTLLLNRSTGEFNMVDTTGFLAKRDGGVTIAGRAGTSRGSATNKDMTPSASGIAAGPQAYIERTGPGGTDVLLVGPATVAVAAVARGGSGPVQPRASYSTASEAVTADGGAVGADGALWALFRSGSRQQLRRFTLPAGSSTGARLRSTPMGSYDARSTVESATANDDGTGGDVVGVAAPGRIRIFRSDGTGGTDDTDGSDTAAVPVDRTVTYRAPAGLDALLPVTNARGRLSWLLHGTDGWSVLSVRTDGTGRTGPVGLGTVDPSASLAPPAQSLGELYTMPRSGSDGSIYRIGLDGRVASMGAYPQKKGADGRSLESASFADAYLIARDSRVVVDSPSHYLAETLFTDGSHRPYVIQKTNLTSLNAANGAEALTRGPVSDRPPKTSTTPPTRAQQTPAPAINNKIDCRQVNQKPHVPQITAVDPSARAIGLSWTYPVIDSQDCLPSTYSVQVSSLSPGAPGAPGSVTLQQQLDTVVSGLYPDSQYSLTVTAYINGQATRSLPVRVTTGKEGPAAAKNISVAVDSGGNWDLAWDGCGASARCVPVDTWTVTPSYCDGRGLSASPPAVATPADPTSVRQPGFVYPGGGALLGRALQFRITGTGADGTKGDVSTVTSCLQSWAPPVPGNIRLTASTPPQTADASRTSRTTAALTFAGGAQHDLGGLGGTITYQLLRDGTVVDTVGPTTATTANLDGIRPGRDYQVRAVVAPPGHADRAATVGPVGVTRATSAWPAVGASVGNVHDTDATTAAFALRVTGLTGSDERFDVSYRVQCGNASPGAASANGIDPANPITVTLNRVTYNGSCAVELLRVAESSAGVYGGTPATNLSGSGSFSVDPPTLTGIDDADLSATWDGSTGDGRSQVLVRYSGSNPVIAAGLGSWSVTVKAPDGTTCGTGGGLGDVAVDQSCVDAAGASGAGWTVTGTYSYLGTDRSATRTGIAGGAAPTYSPPRCDVSSVTASWSGTAAAPSVDVTGTAADVKDCRGWSYTVVGPQTPSCATGASTAPPQTIDIDTTACSDTPATTGWSVTVGYTDPDGDAHTVSRDVEGDPPA